RRIVTLCSLRPVAISGPLGSSGDGRGTRRHAPVMAPAPRWGNPPGRSVARPFGSDDLADRLGPLDADELLVEPAVEVGEPLRVEAELGEDRGVQVLDVEA